MARTEKGIKCLAWLQSRYGIAFNDRFNIVDAVIEFCEEDAGTQGVSQISAQQSPNVSEVEWRLLQHMKESAARKIVLEEDKQEETKQ